MIHSVPPEQVAYLDQFLVGCYYDAKKIGRGFNGVLCSVEVPRAAFLVEKVASEIFYGHKQLEGLLLACSFWHRSL